MSNSMPVNDARPRGPLAEPALDGIAVVGMAATLPGAHDVEQYWTNLRAGRVCITRYAEQDLRAEGLPEELLADPAYVRAFGRIEGPEEFDAELFGMTAREAASTDPQHRLMLQCAWRALENASCNPDRFDGPIGVYVSASSNSYVSAMGDNASRIDPFQLAIGNEKDFLASRIAYKLNLHGPAIAVQTACSSSLVAVHLACEALHSGEVDAALAGGVSITYPLVGGYRYQSGGVLSPDGTCRPFDNQAAGTVPGNGVGLVVLKRLADALEAGDTIHAVIRGSAVNNDGFGKISYTAPSAAGQAAVIAAALEVAGVDGASIGFVETHGTGTPLGDPIELAALRNAIGDAGSPRVALGAVKATIGHLDAASGIAGLIKAILVVRNGEVPPNPMFSRPNEDLSLDFGPFYVNTELVPWVSDAFPRRAGVSSFGIGGTNAHVVLEQAPPQHSADATDTWESLKLSALSERALTDMRSRLASHLDEHPQLALPNVAAALEHGRRELTYRTAVVARDLPGATSGLRSSVETWSVTGLATAPPVAFMFPPEGTEYVGMAHSLYESNVVFQHTLRNCARVLSPLIGLQLQEVLYPTEDREQEAKALLQKAAFAQPALFAVEYALAHAWMAEGVYPDAVIGQGVGEYVAGCVSGAFELDVALRAVVARGRTDGGAPHVAQLVLGHNYATPTGQRMHHTSRIPFMSGTTGDWMSGEQLADTTYWVQRDASPPVAGLNALLTDSAHLLLEVGPGDVLTQLAASRAPLDTVQRLPVPSLRHRHARREDEEGAAFALAKATLWVHGCVKDLDHAPPTAVKVPLPGYPFARDRHSMVASAERIVPVNPTGSVARSHLERSKTVTAIWCELLGLDEANMDDDLFAVGGDSWLAVQMVDRVQVDLGASVDLADFFSDPTLGAFIALASRPDAAAPAAS